MSANTGSGTRRVLVRPSAALTGLSAVAFSPDGTRVATASRDNSARVFDAATGTELARLEHDNDVNVVAFSPDGTLIATGSDDRSARIFDAATGTELDRLDHDGDVRAVVFSPDGALVATGSGDGSARVFEVKTRALIIRALRVMTRTLIPAELRRYSLPPKCKHVKMWNERSARPAL
jgi:WD40 repeat protein